MLAGEGLLVGFEDPTPSQGTVWALFVQSRKAHQDSVPGELIPFGLKKQQFEQRWEKQSKVPSNPCRDLEARASCRVQQRLACNYLIFST